MAEPTSAYTLRDLIRRVAIAAKVAYYGSDGSKRAAIPIDEYNFDTCLRCVNQGIKTFISNAPSTGWRWMNHTAEITFGIVETTGTVDAGDATSLTDATLSSTYTADDDVNGYYIYDKTQEIYALITDYTTADGKVTCSGGWLDYNDNASSLTPAVGDSFSITDVKTVHGDKSRYYLPDDFHGEITGDITYAAGTGRGHIKWMHESELRRRREISKNTGYPMLAAIRRSPARRKWELIVTPSPTAANTVLIPYKMGFNDLDAIVGITTASGDTSVTIGGIVNEYPDDYFNGWYAYCVAGTGRNSYAKVTDYTGASGKFDVADWLAIDGSANGTNPHATAAYMMICDNYKHPAGIQFDEAVLSACLAAAEMEFEEVASPIPGLSNNEKFYKIDLPNAHQQDARSAPKRLGVIKPSTGRPRPTRVWTDVTYN